MTIVLALLQILTEEDLALATFGKPHLAKRLLYHILCGKKVPCLYACMGLQKNKKPLYLTLICTSGRQVLPLERIGWDYSDKILMN